MKTMHIKPIKNLFYGVFAVLLYSSCNPESLTEMNRDVNRIDEVIPEYMFTGALLDLPQHSYTVIAQGVQYFSTYKEVAGVGDKYYSFNGTEAPFFYYTGTTENNLWIGKLNRLYQIQKALESQAEEGIDNTNKLALVRILKVYFFHQLTDVAGDIPYFEARLGEQGTLSPKYDTQEAIYKDLLKELDEAAVALTANSPSFGNADLFFAGDIVKWKKFAYTLMLRLGMRLTKVDQGTAQTWVQRAIAGGPMSEEGDIAYLSYAATPGSLNYKINSLVNGDYNSPGGDNVEGGKYAATFINHLKNTADPRLPVLSVVWVRNADGSYRADNSIGTQRGMINGSLNTFPSDFDSYSEPSQLYLNTSSPIIILGPAEAYLLLAEAAIRGWYTGSSAAEAYNQGVRMAMKQWALWPDVAPHSGRISDQQISNYLTQNPFLATGSFEQQFGQINTQKWVSLFGDDYEVFANWRRTNYPTLMPVNYPGNVTGGKMFRRFYIPLNENLTNRENYMEALQRQGFSEFTGDNLTTRVWWDAE
ncbi:SusD/RagB family nutrient-binding outer membrane lipoprotein [Sphingobacterium paludis]|uniref:SusD/RagB-like outer membrane lipoprotein n=1 Tax=Sphingobacterium paludis TaxID=1476465 RepID=A0A4R7CT11_9SPHI|nr:SusD/RagB family nutrient-binding outer membrane lipoprotein [Sphingobacterium paludis]TDS09761.1 SusD/RagB-like outer membrane lipoprotein [Sphingobacterium paludis]